MGVLQHKHKTGDLGYGLNATRNGGAVVLNGAVSDEPSPDSQAAARQKRKELMGQYAQPVRADQPSPLVTGKYNEDGRLVVTLNMPEQETPAASDGNGVWKQQVINGETRTYYEQLDKTEPTTEQLILAELQRLSTRLDALEIKAQPKPKAKRGRPRKSATAKNKTKRAAGS